MHTDVGVMIVTATIIAIIIAIGYLYLNQRAQAAVPGATGGSTTGTGGTSNANAWIGLFGGTLSGAGGALSRGGF